MLTYFAEFHEIESQGAGDKRPQIAAHANVGFDAFEGGPAAVTSWPPPGEHMAVAKVSIFNVALPVPDAGCFRLAMNSSAIIFAPLPCQHRKVFDRSPRRLYSFDWNA